MSSSTPRRRRLAPAAMGVVIGALVLAGCGSGQGTADNYGQMESAFVKSCEDTLADDAAAAEEAGEEPAAVPDDFCQCAFDQLSGDGENAVEFDRIMEINDELRDDPAALPDDVIGAFAGCSA